MTKSKNYDAVKLFTGAWSCKLQSRRKPPRLYTAQRHGSCVRHQVCPGCLALPPQEHQTGHKAKVWRTNDATSGWLGASWPTLQAPPCKPQPAKQLHGRALDVQLKWGPAAVLVNILHLLQVQLSLCMVR